MIPKVEKKCACGAVWDASRFAEYDCVTDCPHCTPEAWSLAISLTGCKPLRIEAPNAREGGQRS